MSYLSRAAHGRAAGAMLDGFAVTAARNLKSHISSTLPWRKVVMCWYRSKSVAAGQDIGRASR